MFSFQRLFYLLGGQAEFLQSLCRRRDTKWSKFYGTLVINISRTKERLFLQFNSWRLGNLDLAKVAEYKSYVLMSHEGHHEGWGEQFWDWEHGRVTVGNFLSFSRGVNLIFTGGHSSLAVAFKGPSVILGLYKCNYSLTRGKELSTAAW